MQIGTAVVNTVIHGELSETLTLARQLIVRQELFSQMWLEDQARVRGREVAPIPGLSSINISVVPTTEWIRDRLASRLDINQAKVARAAGIIAPEMSNAKRDINRQAPVCAAEFIML